MKYAFMTFSCPELTLDEVIAKAAEFGYDGIEPRVEAKHAHGIELSASAEQRAAIREKMSQSPVDMCCIATSCKYANPKTAEESVRVTNDYIDLAGDVGCSRLRVFGGLLEDGVSRADAQNSIVQSLSSVADHARQRGVSLCFETHDAWCDPKDVAGVMEKVDHPNIRVNWDIMHPVRRGGSTMEQAFDILKPWISHVHFHDGVMEDAPQILLPIGEGVVDHRTAVKLLMDMGYDGYLSGEWINWEQWPWPEHLPAELAKMKQYEAQ